MFENFPNLDKIISGDLNEPANIFRVSIKSYFTK